MGASKESDMIAIVSEEVEVALQSNIVSRDQCLQKLCAIKSVGSGVAPVTYSDAQHLRIPKQEVLNIVVMRNRLNPRQHGTSSLVLLLRNSIGRVWHRFN